MMYFNYEILLSIKFSRINEMKVELNQIYLKSDKG